MKSLLSPMRSACALALSAALFATGAQAQVLEEGPSFEVTGIGVTIEEFGSVEIDLNKDRIADFVVEVWTADGGGSVEANEFAAANFAVLPSEFAFIRSTNEPGFSSSLSQTFDAELSDAGYRGFVAQILGANERKFEGKEITQGLIYADIADDIGTRSFGPLSEIGDQGFLGLTLNDNIRREATFGFLEISRGSLNFLTLSTTTDNALGSTAPSTLTSAATVPLPAPLALLGFGVAALFGLRRFRA